jgi:UDP-glucose 4-epimerase
VANSERDAPSQALNIARTARLVVSARAVGGRVFLGVGSQAEYGPKSAAIGPGDTTLPTSLYGTCKLAAGRLAGELATQCDIRFVWLRLLSAYGPTDHPYWMIPGLIGTLLNGGKPILTASEQRWDFLHARDVARAVRLALEQSHARGVYVLGSGSAPSLRSTIETIRDLIDPALPLGFGEVPYRPDQVMLLQADVTRLEHELGWRAETGLPAGLAERVEWYRANPWIFERERPE